MEPVDELLDVLVDERVVRDLEHPRVQLRGRRELPVQQQVRGLEKRALLGELLDRVAAVAQNAARPVDVADGALARGRVDEPRVVREQTGIVFPCLDLTEVYRAYGAVLDRQLVLFPGAIVCDAETVLRHATSPGSGRGKIC